MKGFVTVILTCLMLFPGIAAATDQKSTQVPPARAGAKQPPQKLDINRASREDLVGIPGIGPRMAQAIVDLRLKKGAYGRIEDLLEVRGIKEKKLASLNRYLEVIALETAVSARSATQSQ